MLDELVQQRLTLVEAAAQFRQLTVEPAEFPGRGPVEFPGRTEEERYCREVIQWVKGMATARTSDRSTDILEHLEAELEAHMDSHGGEVILPDM